MPGSLETWNAPSTLTRLDVSETDFDDACCHSLSHCWELEEVNLADALVTDSGLASLADKQQLKYLDLRRTIVTGKEFGAGVASLAFIDASGSDFSDTGVRALAKLGKLREVRLVGTNVTDTGIEELVRSHYQSGISLKLAVSGPLVSRRKVNELRGDSSIVVIDVFGPPLRD